MIAVAQGHAALGEIDSAVAWLREILSGPCNMPFTPASLRIDPRFQNVIARPEGQALLKDFAYLDAPKTTAASSADQKSIAVLAFENRSSDKDGESFSDGISEELLNVLARVPGLKVAASTSSFSFKGKPATAQEIGQKLGVGYFVEGTVKRSGDRVRITAKLINTTDGLTVWASDPLEPESKDVWAVQDEIAGRIAQKLQLQLGTAGRPAKSVNPVAHQLVLLGRHYWGRRTLEDFDRAEQAFQDALKLDPQFAPAHAGLADNSMMRAVYRMLDGEIDVAADLACMRAEAQQALALDGSLVEPQAALGYALLLEGKLDAAEAKYREALALNPNYSTAHQWLGVMKNCAGRLDIALEEFEQATTLDPLAPINRHVWCETLCHARRLDEALAMQNQAAAIRGNSTWPPSQGALASILWQKGRKDDAVEAARTIRRLWPQPPRWFADADAIWVLNQAGLHEEAADYAAQLLKELPATNSHRGLLLSALGRFAEAIPYLERAGVMSRRNLFWDPLFDPFRNDPRFAQLMAKLGWAAEYKVARETLARLQGNQTK
jgi:serine/threonine-protein kinase